MPHSDARALRKQMAGSVDEQSKEQYSWDGDLGRMAIDVFICWTGCKVSYSRYREPRSRQKLWRCMNAVDQIIVLGFSMHQMSEGTIPLD